MLIPSLISETEMAFATAVERNAPTKFIIAAINTAVFGLSAPVAIAVALEFAVS
jgi:ABC-type transport system involved in cytochrome c biogenesis permease component